MATEDIARSQAAYVPHGGFAFLPLSRLRESPTNPRKTFRDIEDLAQSIREVGIVEPLVVRPLDGDAYEIVCGARRFRAATLAGVPGAPCMVRQIDAAQALEIQLIENNERDDVSALEEATAFAELLKLGRSVEDVADKLGRSPTYVRHRLRLLDLDAQLRALLDAGALGVGSALLLAQMPPSRQTEIAAQLAKPGSWGRREGGQWSRAHIVELVERGARRVRLALWSVDDEELPPRACAACPSRTGVQRALFAEAEGEDLCLDASCWSQKTAAFVERERERGTRVLVDAEAEAARGWRSVWLALDEPAEELEAEYDERGLSSEGELPEWGEIIPPTAKHALVVFEIGPERAEVEWKVHVADAAAVIESEWPKGAAALRARLAHAEREQPRREPPTSHESESDGDAPSAEERAAKARDAARDAEIEATARKAALAELIEAVRNDHIEHAVLYRELLIARSASIDEEAIDGMSIDDLRAKLVESVVINTSLWPISALQAAEKSGDRIPFLRFLDAAGVDLGRHLRLAKREAAKREEATPKKPRRQRAKKTLEQVDDSTEDAP